MKVFIDWDRQELERRAQRQCGCTQCANPDKHPCGQVLAKVLPVVEGMLDEAQSAARRELEKDLDWIRQTVHRAHHEGPPDECTINTCDAALKMLGKR